MPYRLFPPDRELAELVSIAKSSKELLRRLCLHGGDEGFKHTAACGI
jgi:hypothetical protein